MAEPTVTSKTQIVDGTGQFLAQELDQFVHDTKLAECKNEYQVVAIMGPQSSGKSTLLNHVFGTNFVMMDALSGRSQTTKGIWLSRSSKISDHFTLVMDLEGSDGRERGEDDTNFERQIALFALAVADVLLVNIWCHDIGREQGSGKPLLKTIFQVNLKLFSPDPNRKKTVLLFVIRDKTKTPLDKLKEVMEDDLNRMWESISKPVAYQDSKIFDFFDIQYAGMSSYEEKADVFLDDAAILRRRFSPDSDNTLVRPNDHLPAGAFALSVNGIWDTIRQQKDLNLPAHKIMVANIRCAEIARDQLAAFTSDQAWQTLEQEALGGPLGGELGDGLSVLPGFNTRLTALLDSCIQGYKEDAMYFDVTVRETKLAELQAELVHVVSPVVSAQTGALHKQQLQALKKELLLGLIQPANGNDTGAIAAAAPLGFTEIAAGARTAAVTAFKKGFNENVRLEVKGLEGKEAVAEFEKAADAVISDLRSERIKEAVAAAAKQLNSALNGPIITLLDDCPKGVWPKLHTVTSGASESSIKTLLQSLSGFSLSPSEQQQLSQDVSTAANAKLEALVREAAQPQTRLSRMKERFNTKFSLDSNKAPRMWRPHENIATIAKQARLAAAQVLAQLAVIRQPPASAGEAWVPDQVELSIMRLAEQDVGEEPAATGKTDGFTGVIDLLSVASWPYVDPVHVLVAPHESRGTWKDFMAASNAAIAQAQAMQQANRMAGNRWPPAWAILAMVVLGWNEFVTVIWSPVYLIMIVVTALFGYSLYQELDVETEMSRGSLPGAIALAGKFGPACKSVLSRTRDAMKEFVQNPGEKLEHMAQMVRELELPGIDHHQGQEAGGREGQYAVDGAGVGGVGPEGVARAGGSGAGAGTGGANVSAAGLSRRRAAAGEE